MAQVLFVEAKANAMDYAQKNGTTELLVALLEPNKLFSYLDYFADYKVEDGKTDKGNTKYKYPYRDNFKVREERTYKSGDKKGQTHTVTTASYVQAVKNAVSRYELLVKVSGNEFDEFYEDYQEAELEILQAYAINVLLDLLAADKDILKGIDGKIEKWEAAKAAEKAAKKNAK